MIGHRGPAPQAADHLDAVDAGQPEVEDAPRRGGGGGQPQRLLARGGHVDLVAARLQVDAPGPGGSAARRRRPSSAVTGATSRARLEHHRGAAPGRVVERQLAAHRVDEAPGDGEPEPDAVAGRCRPAAGTARRRRRVRAAGCPGRGRRPGDRRGPAIAPASTRTGSPGGAQLEGVVDQVGDAPVRAAPGSASTGGSVSGTSTSTSCRRPGRPPAPRRRPRRGRPAACSHGDGAGLDAAHVEQVADEVVEPIGLLVDGVERSSRRSSGTSERRLQEARRRRLDRWPAACAGRGTRPRGGRCAARCASASAVGGRRLGLQTPALEGDRELGDEGAEHPPVGRRGGPDRRGEHEHPSVPSGSTTRSASVGVAGRLAGRGLDDPPGSPGRRRSTATRVEAERRDAGWRASSGMRIAFASSARPARQRLGLGSGPGAPRRARRAATSTRTLTTPATTTKTTEGDEVAVVADRERVERRSVKNQLSERAKPASARQHAPATARRPRRPPTTRSR